MISLLFGNHKSCRKKIRKRRAQPVVWRCQPPIQQQSNHEDAPKQIKRKCRLEQVGVGRSHSLKFGVTRCCVACNPPFWCLRGSILFVAHDENLLCCIPTRPDHATEKLCRLCARLSACDIVDSVSRLSRCSLSSHLTQNDSPPLTYWLVASGRSWSYVYICSIQEPTSTLDVLHVAR